MPEPGLTGAFNPPLLQIVVIIVVVVFVVNK
jgi:hypothetical protein